MKLQLDLVISTLEKKSAKSERGQVVILTGLHEEEGLVNRSYSGNS